MDLVFRALIGLFRLGAIALFMLAAGVAGGGWYLGERQAEAMAEREAEKAAALAAGPPPAVEITAFDRDAHVGPLNEVQVRAQLDLSMDYELTLEKSGADSYAYMIPLIAARPEAGAGAKAKDLSEMTAIERLLQQARPVQAEPEVLGVVLYSGPGFELDDISPMMLMLDAEEMGSRGPILTLNGALGGHGEFGEMVRDSFEEQGRTLPEGVPVIKPYLEGRAAALAPREPRAFGLFHLSLAVAGVLVLLGVVRLAVGDRFGAPRPKAPQAPAAGPLGTRKAAFEPVDPVLAAARTSQGQMPLPPGTSEADMPEWQRRLRAKAEAGQSGVPGALQARAGLRDKTADTALGDLRPVRRSGGLGVVHRALIGVLLVAFVLVLGATVWGLVSDAAARDAARAPAQVSTEEALARSFAEAVVPSTPAEERGRWDVDFAPAAQWVVKTWALAISGDKGAQLTLGLIFGGLTLSGFLIRWFLAVRGSLRPRNRVISTMGYN